MGGEAEKNSTKLKKSGRLVASVFEYDGFTHERVSAKLEYKIPKMFYCDVLTKINRHKKNSEFSFRTDTNVRVKEYDSVGIRESH